MQVISEFRGRYSFLSNFYYSWQNWNGYSFATNEHFFQAFKAERYDEFEKAQLSVSPGLAKRFGRACKMRSDWDDVKLEVMLLGVRLKFQQNREIAYKLQCTGQAVLMEGNYWNDTFWGVCNGVGENWLGKILMQVRGELNAA